MLVTSVLKRLWRIHSNTVCFFQMNDYEMKLHVTYYEVSDKAFFFSPGFLLDGNIIKPLLMLKSQTLKLLSSKEEVIP